VHRYNAQHCSTEKVLLIFPSLQTNITSRMWPSGGKGGVRESETDVQCSGRSTTLPARETPNKFIPVCASDSSVECNDTFPSCGNLTIVSSLGGTTWATPVVQGGLSEWGRVSWIATPVGLLSKLSPYRTEHISNHKCHIIITHISYLHPYWIDNVGWTSADSAGLWKFPPKLYP